MTDAPSDSMKEPSRKETVFSGAPSACHALPSSTARMSAAAASSAWALWSVTCAVAAASPPASCSCSTWATEQRTAEVATTMATIPMAAASISLFFFRILSPCYRYLMAHVK